MACDHGSVIPQCSQNVVLHFDRAIARAATLVLAALLDADAIAATTARKLHRLAADCAILRAARCGFTTALVAITVSALAAGCGFRIAYGLLDRRCGHARWNEQHQCREYGEQHP